MAGSRIYASSNQPITYGSKLQRRASWYVNRMGIANVEELRRELRRAKSLMRQESERLRALSLQPQWRSKGPQNVTGRIAGLAVGRTDNRTVLAGASGGGVWKTSDQGKFWTPLMWLEDCLTVGALAMAKGNPNTIYVATGEWTGGIGVGTDPVLSGVGIMRSTNAGTSWDLCAPISSHYTSSLVISEQDEKYILVGGDQGVHKSLDGGRSWEPGLGGADAVLAGAISDVVMDPFDSGKLYAAVDRLGFFRSNDAGKTWHTLKNGLPDGYDVEGPKLSIGRQGKHKSNFLLAKTRDLVFASKDGGALFQQIADLGDKIYFYSWCNLVSAHPFEEDLIIAGSNNLYRSLDAGKSWGRVGGYGTTVHPDQQALEWTSDGSQCFLANDGGVWHSTDKGGSWSFCSNGLVGSHFYVMSTAQSNSVRIAGSIQDDDGYVSSGSAAHFWNPLGRGEGGYVEIDPTNRNRIYHDTWFKGLARSEDGGKSWRELNVETDSGLAEPLAIKPNQSSVLVAIDALGTIIRSSNYGDTWKSVLVGPSRLRSASFSRVDASRVIAAGDDSAMFLSDDAGATWRPILTSGMPKGNITAVGLSTADRDTILASMTLAGEPRMFRGIKLASGVPLWEELSSGLPKLPVIAVASFGTAPRWFCACVLGVYEWLEGSKSWHAFNYGLPAVAISDIDVNHSANLLYVSTLGMGVFECQLK